MPVDTPHPEYSARAETWKMVRDSLEGERKVKDGGPDYLPVPPGMPYQSFDLLDGGKRVTTSPYDFYMGFAEFPEIVEPALNGFQGVIHAKPPICSLPPAFEYLNEMACPDGSSLQVLWSLITKEVLSTGKVGILIDVDELDNRLRLVPYSIENVINWREQSTRQGGGVDFLVLRELVQQVDDNDEFKVETYSKYRELRIVNGVYRSRVWNKSKDSEGRSIYSVSNIDNSTPEGWQTISMRGKEFAEIPFTSINPSGIGMGYQAIPILPMVRRAYSIYRKTADYHRALYIKADPQICIAGISADEAPQKVGGDGIWTFPNSDAKAWYLDIDGQGIPLMRQSIKDEYDRFDLEGGKLLATDKTAPESGEALRRRQMSQQVTLRNIVINVGMAMESVLKELVFYSGGNPEDVLFKPDTDFAEPTMSSQDLLGFVTAKNNGAPIAYRTMHDLMRRGGLTEKTFDEEIQAMKEDKDTLKQIVESAPKLQGGSVDNGQPTQDTEADDSDVEDADEMTQSDIVEDSKEEFVG